MIRSPHRPVTNGEDIPIGSPKELSETTTAGPAGCSDRSRESPRLGAYLVKVCIYTVFVFSSISSRNLYDTVCGSPSSLCHRMIYKR